MRKIFLPYFHSMTFHKFLSFISAPPTCFRKKRMSIIKLRRTEHSIPFHNVPFHTFVMYLLYVDIFVVCRGRQIDSSRPALAFTAEMNQQFVPEAIPRGKEALVLHTVVPRSSPNFLAIINFFQLTLCALCDNHS